MAKTWKPHKPWTEYKLRTCRWINDCAICKEPIRSGEQYYDGGYNLRAHKKCVDAGERNRLAYEKADEEEVMLFAAALGMVIP